MLQNAVGTEKEMLNSPGERDYKDDNGAKSQVRNCQVDKDLLDSAFKCMGARMMLAL